MITSGSRPFSSRSSNDIPNCLAFSYLEAAQPAGACTSRACIALWKMLAEAAPSEVSLRRTARARARRVATHRRCRCSERAAPGSRPVRLAAALANTRNVRMAEAPHPPAGSPTKCVVDDRAQSLRGHSKHPDHRNPLPVPRALVEPDQYFGCNNRLQCAWRHICNVDRRHQEPFNSRMELQKKNV